MIAKKKQLRLDTQDILTYLGYPDFVVGIQLCDLKTMQEYNKQYRDKDKPTDILSFPFYPDLKAGEKIVAHSDEEKNLGDIVICPEYVEQDLERWGQTFDERMRVLLVHGICHLLGYDHILDSDYEIMKKEEEKILTFLAKKKDLQD